MMLESIPTGGPDELKGVKCSASNFEVSEITQCSVDLVTQIGDYFTAVDAISDEGVTMVHDQHKTQVDSTKKTIV